jgi:hypothetical protein
LTVVVVTKGANISSDMDVVDDFDGVVSLALESKLLAELE